MERWGCRGEIITRCFTRWSIGHSSCLPSMIIYEWQCEKYWMLNFGYNSWWTEYVYGCVFQRILNTGFFNAIQQPQHLCTGLGYLQQHFTGPFSAVHIGDHQKAVGGGPDRSRLVGQNQNIKLQLLVRTRYQSHNLQGFGLLVWSVPTLHGHCKEKNQVPICGLLLFIKSLLLHYCFSLDTLLWLWKTPKWIEAARPDGESPNATAAHASQPQTWTDAKGQKGEHMARSHGV